MIFVKSKKSFSSLAIFPALILGLFFCYFYSAYIFGQASYPRYLTLQIADQSIHVEVVSSEIDREEGLSHREKLAANAGMLFVFGTIGKYPIWMKDMKFPIDILWLDKDMQIISIKENVSPSTYPEMFYPDQAASFALELNAGFVKQFHIQMGDKFSVVNKSR